MHGRVDPRILAGVCAFIAPGRGEKKVLEEFPGCRKKLFHRLFSSYGRMEAVDCHSGEEAERVQREDHCVTEQISNPTAKRNALSYEIRILLET